MVPRPQRGLLLVGGRIIAPDLKEQFTRKTQEQALVGVESLNIPLSPIFLATHVDYSGRIKMTNSPSNSNYHSLLSKFDEITYCPATVNTSFNVRGKPNVRTPDDAFGCLMGTELEMLVFDNFIISESAQDKNKIQIISKYMALIKYFILSLP